MTPQETDQLLDRTLHALANTEPAPGFTDRLERTLAQHSLSQRNNANFGQIAPRSFVTRLALPLSLATLLFVVALSLLLPKRPNARRNTQPNASNSVLSTLKPQRQPGKIPSEAPAPGLSEVGISKSTAQVRATPSAATAKLLITVSSPDTTLNPTLDPDQQALVDLHTPSFPAPPLSSTEQERLVRLMLRQGEKRDLAELESARIDATFRRERSEFSMFFDPPLSAATTSKQLETQPVPTPAIPAPVDDSTKSQLATPQPENPQPENPGDPQ